LVSVISLAFLTLHGEAASQIVTPVTAQIQGRVTDGDGKVLAGATVTVTNVRNGIVDKTETDNRGRYAIGGLEPGTYDVAAEQSGYVQQSFKGNSAKGGENILINFALRPVAASRKLIANPAHPEGPVFRI
jgi:protocatechuate 3,4-dioxygenase beta subunit